MQKLIKLKNVSTVEEESERERENKKLSIKTV